MGGSNCKQDPRRLFIAAGYAYIGARLPLMQGLKGEIMTPPPEPTDLELIRRIAATGGTKYTAGNIDRRKYQRLVALGWLTEASTNISDVLYEVTDAGRVAALRDGW